MDQSKPCTEGGKRHSVDERALEEARANADTDGSYTVACEACGQRIVKGPTDLTGTAPGGQVAR